MIASSPIDVRIIAATNKKLQRMMSENKFREDLFYRLNVLRLNIPPLRERKKDIPHYVSQFLKEISRDSTVKMSKSAIKIMEYYTWPGNIRELRNVMERIAALSQRDTVSAAFVSKVLNIDGSVLEGDESQEVKDITAALHNCNRKMGDVAKLLKMSRSTLWRKMKRYGISE